MKYTVQYQLPHIHTCQVGIEAPDRETAIQRARELFESGHFYDNTAERPLLCERFDEDESAGWTLDFEVVGELPGDQPWPSPTADERAAFRAAERLLDAVKDGFLDCGALEQAVVAARLALPEYQRGSEQQDGSD